MNTYVVTEWCYCVIKPCDYMTDPISLCVCAHSLLFNASSNLPHLLEYHYRLNFNFFFSSDTLSLSLLTFIEIFSVFYVLHYIGFLKTVT